MAGLLQSGLLKDQQISKDPRGALEGALNDDSPETPLMGKSMPEEETQDPNAATPEEQEAFSKVELMAMDLIWNDKTKDKLVKVLEKGSEEPVPTLANTTMMIFGQVDDQSGGTIPETVVAHSADTILEEVINLAESSGAFPVDENIAGQARQATLMKVAEEFGVEPEDAQELMEGYGEEELQEIRITQEGYNPTVEESEEVPQEIPEELA